MFWIKGMIYSSRLLFILSGMMELVNGNWGKLGLLFGSLLLTFLPEVFTRLSKLHITPDALLGYHLFIFCAQWLGTYLRCYDYFFWWDIMLHFTSGILLSYIGLLILMCLDKEGLLISHHKWLLIALFMGTVSLAGAAVWEIFEFSSDTLLGSYTQLGSLQDTMEDIIYGTLGAIVSSISIYRNASRGKKSSIDKLQRYNKV